MLKKSLLALAVAGLSANAFAVDLDAGTGVATFASEIDVPSSGLVVGSTTKMTVATKAGFGLSNSYVRFDLGNGATFGTALTNASLVTSGAATIALASGGQAGDNYAIFSLNGSTTSADLLTLTTDAKVVNENAVPVSYAIYETAAGAANKANALSSKSGNLLTFASALTATATGAVVDNIDAIGNQSKIFEFGVAGDKTKANLVNLNVALATTVPLKADGSAVALTDIYSKYNWTLKGNFSAIAATSGLVDAAPTAFTVATDKQSANLDNANGLVTYTVTGTDAIAETDVDAVLAFTPNTGYKVDPISFNKVASLTKNGTTKGLDLALKPGGAFSNFIRITNTDTIPGVFFIKVINDAGESASFSLGDVTGQSASIAAGASTTQISINDIFAAAQAKGLALSGEGKLRLEVTGQTNRLSVQEYTVSTDGTTFSTF